MEQISSGSSPILEAFAGLLNHLLTSYESLSAPYDYLSSFTVHSEVQAKKNP